MSEAAVRTSPVVMHGGHTDRFPTDTVAQLYGGHMLLDVAEWGFRKYQAQRPQLVFDEPEIWVQEDVIRMTVRGEWRATAYVDWP